MTLTIVARAPKALVLGAESRCHYFDAQAGKKTFRDDATKIAPFGNKYGVTLTGQIERLNKSGEPVDLDSLVKSIGREKISEQPIEDAARILVEEVKSRISIERELSEQENLLRQVASESGLEIVKVDEVTNVYGIGLSFTLKAEDGEVFEHKLYLPTTKFNVAGYNLDESGSPDYAVCKILFPDNFTETLRGDYLRDIGGAKYGYEACGDTSVNDSVVVWQRNHQRVLDNLHKTPDIEKNRKRIEELLAKVNGVKSFETPWSKLSPDEAAELVSDIIELSKLLDGNVGLEKILLDKVSDDIPQVGGPIDLAVITPKHGFKWHTVKGKRVSL